MTPRHAAERSRVRRPAADKALLEEERRNKDPGLPVSGAGYIRSRYLAEPSVLLWVSYSHVSLAPLFEKVGICCNSIPTATPHGIWVQSSSSPESCLSQWALLVQGVPCRESHHEHPFWGPKDLRLWGSWDRLWEGRVKPEDFKDLQKYARSPYDPWWDVVRIICASSSLSLKEPHSFGSHVP